MLQSSAWVHDDALREKDCILLRCAHNSDNRVDCCTPIWPSIAVFRMRQVFSSMWTQVVRQLSWRHRGHARSIIANEGPSFSHFIFFLPPRGRKKYKISFYLSVHAFGFPPFSNHQTQPYCDAPKSRLLSICALASLRSLAQSILKQSQLQH